MTYVLYLHGVGDDGTRLDWTEGLELAPGQLIAPDYSDLLTDPPADSAEILPSMAPRSSAAARRAFRAEQARLHDRLLSVGAAALWPDRGQGLARVPKLIDALAEAIVVGLVYEQVAQYANNATLRQTIRERILEHLPADGSDLVIVGHSLGAVIALDLVRNAPDGLHTRLLVTAASALARRQVPREVAELAKSFPYERVCAWVNVYNPADVVTRGVPIGPKFPQAIDVRVKGGFADHALATCIREPGIQQAIRESLAADRPGRPPRAVKDDRSHLSPLSRRDALKLVAAQLMFRMEDVLAGRPNVTPVDLAKMAEASKLADEARSLVSHRPDFIERDYGPVLRGGIVESDIPALLLRLTSVDPLAAFSIEVPETVRAEARRLTAIDMDLPAHWVDLAQTCADRVRNSLPALDRDRVDWRPDAAAGRLRSTELDIRESIQSVLRELSVGTVQTRLSDGIIDLRPHLTELLSRALLADRLGHPLAGAEEREALSRLMVTLGEGRARLSEWPQASLALSEQLRQHRENVAAGLTWMAEQGVAVLPGRARRSATAQ